MTKEKAPRLDWVNTSEDKNMSEYIRDLILLDLTKKEMDSVAKEHEANVRDRQVKNILGIR